MLIDYAKDSKELIELLSNAQDIVRMDFESAGISASMIYIDGIIDKELTERNIIQPLKALEYYTRPFIDTINQHINLSAPIIVVKNIIEASKKVADGDIAFLLNGAENIIIFSIRKYNTRDVSEPAVSSVLRGPREGFIEDMKTNLTLIRRRLKTPDLSVESLKAGKYSNSSISLVYIKNIADKKIVNQIKDKINKIDIDGIIDSSYIARFLEERRYTIFTQVGASEKPDIIASKLLEGRVAIIVDGSPTVLTLPFILFEHFQSSQDYYIKSYRATLTRIIRVLAVFISMILPSAYIALQEFQYQMFPYKMLLPILNSIQGIPLSPTLEMILLLVLFEILNEAAVRMPRYIGMSLSIVGAIILGDSAINAGLLSTPALLVAALSTIGMYCAPDEVDSTSVLRFAFVALAGVIGLFGLILGCMVLLSYLSNMKSFGTSYLSPYAPSLAHDFEDGVIKDALLDMKSRPYSIPNKNHTRLKINEPTEKK